MDCPDDTASKDRLYEGSRTGAYVGLGTWALHLPEASNTEATTVAVFVATIVFASISFVMWRRGNGGGPSDDESVTGGRPIDAHRGSDGEERPDDHEVVRREIRARGGRTRQSVIVEETGWSKAKVSSVLAAMEEEGAVSKLRVGRENLVSLPGHEPDAVESALEE